MQWCRDHPVAAPRLAAFRKIAGQVQRAALAGIGPPDRPVMGMDTAYPQLDPARGQHQPVAGRGFPGRHGPGYHQPDAGQRKGAVDRHAERPRRRARRARYIGGAAGLAQMRGQCGDAVAGDARHGEDRAAVVAGLGEQGGNLGLDCSTALGRYPTSSAASCTRWRTPADTGWVDPFSAREAVAIDTPARRATSASDPATAAFRWANGVHSMVRPGSVPNQTPDSYRLRGTRPRVNLAGGVTPNMPPRCSTDLRVPEGDRLPRGLAAARQRVAAFR